MTIERKLADSREKQWALEARQIDEWSFKDIVFSTEKFMKYTGEIVQKEERVQIDKSVSNKLAGKLEDEAFLGHGNRIREVLQKEVQKMAEQETQISESLKEKRWGISKLYKRFIPLSIVDQTRDAVRFFFFFKWSLSSLKFSMLISQCWLMTMFETKKPLCYHHPMLGFLWFSLYYVFFRCIAFETMQRQDDAEFTAIVQKHTETESMAAAKLKIT